VIAASQYQPSSADDAAAMIARIAGAIDAQADIAADAADDDSYSALRAARGAVVQDLRNRGATLAQVTTYRTNRALPAVVLAQRFYGDATRDAQLVTQVGDAVPNPLFMPTQFEALAS
jgi:prophage DNA circulation protein